jgi:hypothetical protein
MPRNKIISASEVLYASVWATGKHFSSALANTQLSGNNWVYQLFNITSLNYGWRENRTDINTFGQHAAKDRVVLDSPTVNLNFSYNLANFNNELVLGFHPDGNVSCISGILSKARDEKNYFIKITPEGTDAIGDANNDGRVFVEGFGNGYLTSYRAQGAVGNFASADVSIEALNFVISTGISGSIPSVNQSNGTRVSGYSYLLPPASGNAGAAGTDLDISALRPGDITISFAQRSAEDEGDSTVSSSPYDTFGPSITDAKIQSFDLGFNLNRNEIQKLGSRYAISREIAFPVNIDLNIDAVVGDLATGALNDIVNCDSSYDVTISLYKPNNCLPNQPKTLVCQYAVRNAKIVGQDFSSNIGSNRTVRLAFQSQIGGPNQTGIGLFMSGLYNSSVFQFS